MATETMIFRTANEDDWRELRDLRLEMLADTPIAYGETLAEALALDEAEWRFRARRAASPESTSIVAIDDATGRWVGNMSGYVNHEGDPNPMLVGVYVHPDFRGRMNPQPIPLVKRQEDRLPVRENGANAPRLHGL
jgi:hypothetical protein